MNDRARTEFVTQINDLRKRVESAGKIHKKDLTRQLRRMERELWQYDKFQKAAGR